MRVKKLFGYSKVTTALLLLLIGSISLIAAGSYITQNGLSPVKDAGAAFKSVLNGHPTKLPYFNLLDSPTVTTDKTDYPIGATVVISGSGWQPGEIVTLQVTDDLAPGDPNHEAHAPWDVVADASGNISSTWTVDADADGLTLTLTATGSSSGSVSTTFTDANPSANLDQCANDPAPSPSSDGCDSAATQWVNGNLGASKSSYFEGDSIPYRLTFGNLPLSSHTVTIEWDTTKSSTHAIDYLTTFNQSVLDANPCLGVSGCNPSSFDIEPIPADPQVTGAGVTPIAGNFAMYGGTITAVSAYSYSNGTGFSGDKSARITITFTPSVANPVLAWGGHIATRVDWGLTNSAVSIPGSPYHTRLIDLDGSGGNQDRSLSADAVIFPGSITIIKDAQPNTSTSFSYTASPAPPLSNFSLIDDGTSSNTKVFSNIIDFQTYTIAETQLLTWKFDSVSCSVTSANGGSYTTTTSTVNINMKEGENWSCTYINKEDVNATHGTILVDKVTDPSGSSQSFEFTPSYNSGTHFFLTDGSTPNDSGLIDPGTYSVAETQATNWTLTSATCTSNLGDPADNPSAIHLREGETVTCTFTNTRDQGYFKIKKVFDALTSGFVGSFTIHYDCGAGDQTVSLAAGATSEAIGPFDTGTSCAVTEPSTPTAPTGWTFGTPSVSGSPVTIVKDTAATTASLATVTNSITRDLGSFKITKTVSNPDGATLPAAFTGTYNCGTGFTGTWSVAAGGSQTVSNIPTGNTCSVTEDALTAITGFTWGTPSFTPTSIVVSTKGGTFEIVVGNSITRDLGSLVLAKSLTGGPAGYTGPFTIDYNCGAGYTGSVSVSAGSSQTVSGIPTGTSCTVSETPPTPPTGYSFGTPSFSPSATVTIPAGNGSSVTVTTNNTLTRDTGSLKIYKTLSNPDGASVQTSFTVNYSCDDGSSGQVSVTTATPATISGIPTGSTCSVTEVAPTAVAGYTWGTITYAPASVVISTKAGTFSITVGNSITRDRGSLTIVKKVVNDNGDNATVSAFGLNTSAGSLTFDSGSTSGSTTTYTSQKFILVTATYTLKENDVYGYTEGTWSCTGAAGTVVPTYNNGSVQVGKNEDITCTITNDDQPGTIVIIKNAKPQSGTFTFNTTGSTSGSGTSWPTSFMLNGATAGNGNVKSFTADAGTYSASESTQMGWLLTGIGGSSDPLTPYACVVTGSGGSTGSGDLSTRIATINLKNGDTVTCTFENTGNGATRTQGFWATHPNLAIIAWNGGTSTTDPAHTFPGVEHVSGIGDKLLCTKAVDFPDLIGPNNSDVMGGFWSDISKTSTSGRRSKQDNSRMSLLQQLLAAELNASAFGSSPSSGSFSAWESAYCGGNANALQTAQQQAASFNTQGDSSTFTPGTSANSKLARLLAEYTRWDLLP